MILLIALKSIQYLFEPSFFFVITIGEQYELLDCLITPEVIMFLTSSQTVSRDVKGKQYG